MILPGEICLVDFEGHFSLNTTTFSRDSTRFLPGRGLRFASLANLRRFRFPGLDRNPMTPDVIETQHHESDQRLSPPPLVPHLLPGPNHPVGPLHMIVGPDALADRVVKVGHDLGELFLT